MGQGCWGNGRDGGREWENGGPLQGESRRMLSRGCYLPLPGKGETSKDNASEVSPSDLPQSPRSDVPLRPLFWCLPLWPLPLLLPLRQKQSISTAGRRRARCAEGEAFARATVAFTRAQRYCFLMCPLDMKGLIGAATVVVLCSTELAYVIFFCL